MWQLTGEVKDKRIKANLYVDDWPKFTTIITQEFTPRLSEVIISFNFVHNQQYNKNTMVRMKKKEA